MPRVNGIAAGRADRVVIAAEAGAERQIAGGVALADGLAGERAEVSVARGQLRLAGIPVVEASG